MIRRMVLLGAVIYIVIAAVQWVANRTVFYEAVIFSGILVALSLVHYAENEERLKKMEMTVVWLVILLFVGYALAKAGGYL
ncbi:MAG: hypothetical protein PHT97_09745 [Methanoculleus sp.]|nr:MULTISPECIES: hypothetical protein [unclassified Methanoculleus]MCK9318156.1 hypothetical protein [Methanoculleus sp.]MDD2254497.1 hypothetical protein [Methanoculleus sp.]MDD3216780.1 hypothetical protein [Methanoculleus sp.]MDD4314838.1 hypothetical protein [Methanoculleus sp.]MDD4471421.1 hypothetical protein [Methanoculleus sp.]